MNAECTCATAGGNKQPCSSELPNHELLRTSQVAQQPFHVAISPTLTPATALCRVSRLYILGQGDRSNVLKRSCTPHVNPRTKSNLLHFSVMPARKTARAKGAAAAASGDVKEETRKRGRAATGSTDAVKAARVVEGKVASIAAKVEAAESADAAPATASGSISIRFSHCKS